MKAKNILLAAVVTASTLASQVYAAGDSYVGLGFGSAKYDTGVTNLTGTADLDEKDNSFKIFYGFNVASQISVELHYADFGDVSLTGNTGDNLDYDGDTFEFTDDDVSVKGDAKSFGVSGVFKLFEEATVNPYLKAGVHRWDTKTIGKSVSGSDSVNDDGFDLFFGLGAEVKLSDSFFITAEYESYKIDSDKVDVASVGAKFTF
jgi:OmpA-OmpF porin, OOP family